MTCKLAQLLFARGNRARKAEVARSLTRPPPRFTLAVAKRSNIIRCRTNVPGPLLVDVSVFGLRSSQVSGHWITFEKAERDYVHVPQSTKELVPIVHLGYQVNLIASPTIVLLRNLLELEFSCKNFEYLMQDSKELFKFLFEQIYREWNYYRYVRSFVHSHWSSYSQRKVKRIK